MTPGVATKVCGTCGASDWGTRNRCNPCRARRARATWAANAPTARAADRGRHRAWRAANPDRALAQKRRQRYAVSDREVEALLAKQGGRCAICRAESPNCLDHCHVTGRARGVLCRACNAGLGQFRDDPDRLRAAVAYLAAAAVT